MVTQLTLVSGPAPPPSAVLRRAVAFALPEVASLAWLDLCLSCCTTGTAKDMLICVDCGEAYHTFCTGAKVPDDEIAAARMRGCWRCANCKVHVACKHTSSELVP